MHPAFDVNDAVSTAEWLASLADQFEGVGDLPIVIGMLMGQYHLGGRGYRPRQIAVHLLHFRRPLPAAVVEVEAEPAHPVRSATGWCLPVINLVVTAAG